MGRAVCVVMCGALFAAGCGPVWYESAPEASVDGVRLLVLTSLEPDASGEGMQLRVFVQPEEGYAAGRLRFELYEFMPLDANPRGKRIVLWPEIEPGAAETGNRYWRPHLGAYEFVLPVEVRIEADMPYLAEVTILREDGTRKSDTIRLKPKQR